MRVREVDNGEVQYVSPVWDDPVDRNGYRFVCGACGWTSPVMKWADGAERHADTHECPSDG